MPPGLGRRPMFPSRTARPPCRTGGRCLADLPPPKWRRTPPRRQSERPTDESAATVTGTCGRTVLLPSCSPKRRYGCGPGRQRTTPSPSVVAFRSPICKPMVNRLGFSHRKRSTQIRTVTGRVQQVHVGIARYVSINATSCFVLVWACAVSVRQCLQQLTLAVGGEP